MVVFLVNKRIRVRGLVQSPCGKINVIVTLTFYPPPPLLLYSVTAFQLATPLKLIAGSAHFSSNAVAKRHALRPPPPWRHNDANLESWRVLYSKLAYYYSSSHYIIIQDSFMGKLDCLGRKKLSPTPSHHLVYETLWGYVHTMHKGIFHCLLLFNVHCSIIVKPSF